MKVSQKNQERILKWHRCIMTRVKGYIRRRTIDIKSLVMDGLCGCRHEKEKQTLLDISNLQM